VGRAPSSHKSRQFTPHHYTSHHFTSGVHVTIPSSRSAILSCLCVLCSVLIFSVSCCAVLFCDVIPYVRTKVPVPVYVSTRDPVAFGDDLADDAAMGRSSESGTC